MLTSSWCLAHRISTTTPFTLGSICKKLQEAAIRHAITIEGLKTLMESTAPRSSLVGFEISASYLKQQRGT
jgi:hypothetical protein